MWVSAGSAGTNYDAKKFQNVITTYLVLIPIIRGLVLGRWCRGFVIFLFVIGTRKKISKSTRSKWLQLDQLDNRSYYTIQPTTITTYNMKIELRPAILEFFDFFSQKLIRTTQQNSHQFKKKCHHRTPSSSPVIILNNILTNINVT